MARLPRGVRGLRGRGAAAVRHRPPAAGCRPPGHASHVRRGHRVLRRTAPRRGTRAAPRPGRAAPPPAPAGGRRVLDPDHALARGRAVVRRPLPARAGRDACPRRPGRGGNRGFTPNRPGAPTAAGAPVTSTHDLLRKTRNSAVPCWASEPRKPNPAGSLMPQRANATGMDPAACRPGPDRGTERVTVTGRATPRIESWPTAVTRMIAPEMKPGPRLAGRVRANVATGSALVSRLVANCGCGFPETVTAVRSTRSVARITWSPESTIVPVTARVRPTTSLLKPSALSGTRNPATDPAATFQVPSAELAGAGAAPCGSASGGGLGWSLMNNPVAATIRTTSAATLARTHLPQ